MATKSGQPEPEKAEVIEELLDALDSALDRVKVLYEQYFLGIQKQPPTYLHTDIERKIRDITQIQVRNTAMRYRFATIQQKFGAYNAYWRRTLRQIENGTYTRNLVKVSRQAARTGAEVPEEILAAMPKRMREQVKRDREAALALAKLREQQREAAPSPAAEADDELLTLAEEEVDMGELTAVISEPARVKHDVRAANGALQIDESDGDFDLDAFFSKVVNEAAPDPAPEQAPVRWGASERPVRSVPTGLAGPAARHPRPTPGSSSGIGASAKPGMPGMRPAIGPAMRPGMGTTQAIPTPRLRADGDDSVTRPLPRPVMDGPPSVPLHAGAPRPKLPPPVQTQTPFSGVPQVARPPAPPSGAGAGAIPSVPRRPSGVIPPASAPAPIRPSAPRLGAAIIPPSVAAAAATRPGMIASASPAGPTQVTPSSGVPTAVMSPLPGSSRPPPPPPKGSVLAPSQATRPSPIAPGASSSMPALPVETMAGPFPRIPAPAPAGAAPHDDPHLRPTVAFNAMPRPGTTPGAGPPRPVPPASPGAPPPARPVGRLGPKGAQTMAPIAGAPLPPPPPRRPPPAVPPPAVPPPAAPRSNLPAGVSDADVNALYTKYVQAKQTLGEQAGPSSYDKLLKTIHAQAPKIMEQYKATGVDFSVVVKDNQVVIRAKPKP